MSTLPKKAVLMSVSECYWTNNATAREARASLIRNEFQNVTQHFSGAAIPQCGAAASYEFCLRNDIRHSQFRSTSLSRGAARRPNGRQYMMALLPKLSYHQSLKTTALTLHFKMKKLVTNSSKKYEGVLLIFNHHWFNPDHQFHLKSIFPT